MNVAEDGGDFAGEGRVPGGGDVVEGSISFGRKFTVVVSADVKLDGGYLGEG